MTYIDGFLKLSCILAFLLLYSFESVAFEISPAPLNTMEGWSRTVWDTVLREDWNTDVQEELDECKSLFPGVDIKYSYKFGWRRVDGTATYGSSTDEPGHDLVLLVDGDIPVNDWIIRCETEDSIKDRNSYRNIEIAALNDASHEGLETASLEFYEFSTSEDLFSLDIQIVDEIEDDPDPGYLSLLAGGFYTGIDKPAFNYHLSGSVRNIQLDSQDRPHFLDNGHIRRINQDGSLSTVFELPYPYLFVIKGDTLYYKLHADFYSVDLDSREETYLFTFAPPAASMYYGDFDVDSNGNVYHFYGGNLYRIDAVSGETTRVDMDFAYTNIDVSLAVDPTDDSLLVLDYYQVQRFNPQSGQIEVVLDDEAGGGGWQNLSVDASGNLYLLSIQWAYPQESHIYRYSESSGLTLLAGNGDKPAFGEEGMSATSVGVWPEAIAVTSNGDFYFSNAEYSYYSYDYDYSLTIAEISPTELPNRIRFVDVSKDIISTVVGIPGFLGCASSTESRLDYIYQLEMHPSGVVYAAVAGSILAIDEQNDILYTVAGIYGVIDSSPDGVKAFGNPTAVRSFAITPDGDIYIAEYDKLRLIDGSTGMLKTVADGYFASLQYQDGHVYAYRMEIEWNNGYKVEDLDFVKVNVATNRVINLVDGGDQPPVIGESAQGRNFVSDMCYYGQRLCFQPFDLAVDPAGNIYFSTLRDYLDPYITYQEGYGADLSSGIYKIDANSNVLSSVLNDDQTIGIYQVFSNIALDHERGWVYYFTHGEVLKLDIDTGVRSFVAGGSMQGYPENPLEAYLIPSELSLAPSGDLLVADDRANHAVVRISQAEPLDSSLLPDNLDSGSLVGKSVANYQNWLAIGVPGGQGGTGEVLIYQDNDCRPILQQRITVPKNTTATGFGRHLAFVGDSLIIGASNEAPPPTHLESSTGTDDDLFRMGRFKVRDRNWWMDFDFSSMLPPMGARGEGALVSGDRSFAVGTPDGDNGRGVVTVFDPDHIENPVTVQPGNAETIRFGRSLAMHGGTLAVGAETATGGSTEIHARSDSGYDFKGVVTSTRNNSGFAVDLAMNDEALYVGAPHASGGRVYDFNLADLGLHDTLADPVNSSNPSFGKSLAIENDVLVIGAPDTPPGAARSSGSRIEAVTEADASSGAVHLFGVRDKQGRRQSGSLMLTLLAGLTEAYGDAVDISDGRIVVGAPDTNDGRGTFDPVKTVIDAADLSGLWYDPSLDGEGFNLLVADHGMVVFFYGYDNDGRRLWLISDLFSGEIEFGKDIHLPVYRAFEGTFDSPVRSSDALVKYGLLSISFGSTRSGTFTINGFDGNKISRSTFLADAQANAAAYSGLWYDPAMDGEGYNVISGQYGSVIYYYGSTNDGERLWLISALLTNDITDGTTVTGTMYDATGGDYYHPAPSSKALRNWGTIEARFDNCNDGHFVLSGSDGNKVSSVVKLAGVTGANCD